MDSKELAKIFHEAYERLAPQFGYETRQDTKVFDPESKNGKLMIAVQSDLRLAAQIRNLALEEAAAACETRAHSYRYATDPWAYEHISEAELCAAAIRAAKQLDQPPLDRQP